MEKVKVKHVYNKESGTLGPILVDFEHAQVATGKRNKGKDLSDDFHAKIFSNTKVPAHLASFLDTDSSVRPSINNKQVIFLDNQRLSYMGSTDNDLNKPMLADGTRTYLVVRSGAKIKVVETNKISVSPRVPNHSYIHEKEAKSKKKTYAERAEAEKSLVKAFGSKKKRLTYENREKNQTVDMNDTLRVASEQAKITEMSSDNVEDQSYKELIPPCNREAAFPDEVYAVSDLLYDEEMEALEESAKTCLQAKQQQLDEWKEQKLFSEFFFSIIKYLKIGRGTPASLQSMKVVLLAELLIRIYKLNYKELKVKRIDFPEIYPPDFAQRVLSDFTNYNALNQRTKPQELQDKICCHIMVAVLIAADFRINFSLMCTIFHMHIKRLMVLAKAVGITQERNKPGEELSGSLKLPLPKLATQRQRAKPKRN